MDVLNAPERENMLEMAHFMLFFTIVKTEIGGREGGGGRSAAGSRPVDGGRGLCPRKELPSCHRIRASESRLHNMIQAMAPSAPTKVGCPGLGRGAAGDEAFSWPWGGQGRPPLATGAGLLFLRAAGPGCADPTASSSEPAPAEPLVCRAARCWALLAGRTGLLSRRPRYVWTGVPCGTGCVALR